jgi:hypothetical protein
MSISGDIEVHHDEDVYTFCDGGISPITEFRKGKQQYPPFWMVAGCCSEGRGVLFFHRNLSTAVLHDVLSVMRSVMRFDDSRRLESSESCFRSACPSFIKIFQLTPTKKNHESLLPSSPLFPFCLDPDLHARSCAKGKHGDFIWPYIAFVLLTAASPFTFHSLR